LSWLPADISRLADRLSGLLDDTLLDDVDGDDRGVGADASGQF